MAKSPANIIASYNWNEYNLPVKEEVNAFLEEAVVRRELSDNFCFYEPNYDNLSACSDWAKDSLEKHRSDKREYLYTW